MQLDTLIDIVKPVLGADGAVESYIYNTYMFRRRGYWMYENRHNRTRSVGARGQLHIDILHNTNNAACMLNASSLTVVTGTATRA